MGRRLSFEQLALNRTKRRSAQIRKLIEAIAYDWYDCIDMISETANDLGRSLDEFDLQLVDIFNEVMRERAEAEAA